MRLKLCVVFALAVLVLCSASALAEGPFAMTYGPGEAPGTWVYTLYNNDTTGTIVPWGLDLYWADPVDPSYYSVTGTPAGWVENLAYTWPAWDAISNDPAPGESLVGFTIAAPTAAPYFTVYYYELGDSREQLGQVVPEPSSMLALFGGVSALGVMIRRRRA